MMIGQEKSGVVRPACEIVCLADFKDKVIKNSIQEQGLFSPYALEASEAAWLASKRRYWNEPTIENKWAEGILHLCFKSMWEVSDDRD